MNPGAPDPDPPIRERAVRVLRRMAVEWREDRVPDAAAGVAFYAVLSLLPAFLTLAAMLGPLDSLIGGEVAERVQERVLDFLGTVLTAEAPDGLVGLQSFVTQAVDSNGLNFLIVDRGGVATVSTAGLAAEKRLSDM